MGTTLIEDLKQAALILERVAREAYDADPPAPEGPLAARLRAWAESVAKHMRVVLLVSPDGQAFANALTGDLPDPVPVNPTTKGPTP